MSSDAVVLVILGWLVSLYIVERVNTRHWSPIVRDLEAEIDRLREKLDDPDEDDEDDEQPDQRDARVGQ
jgi:hypothetical protein